MHTTRELDRASFEYRVDGGAVPRETVMPSVTSADRVGLVMETGSGGLGAGTFVLSCVTAFYDHLSETRDGEFSEYPDYYTFQTTSDPADYRMLDVYPDHKNVPVEPTAEQVLRAINDRAITTLVVPDESPTTPGIGDIARRSAHRRIDHCYAYSPDGRPRDAEFSIRLPRHPPIDWFETTVESLDSESKESIPSFGSNGNKIVQHFRRISVTEALERLPV